MLVRNSAWRIVPLVLAALPLTIELTVQARQAAQPALASSPEFFESKVRPLLASNCYDCHADEQFGGLRLDSREAMLKGGKSGPAIVAGDPDKSLLIEAVRQTGDLKMPKGGRLRPDEIDVLVEWIKAGAVWPSTGTATTRAAAAPKPYVITPAQRAFWSFQPIQKPVVPSVAHGSWPKSDIDRFVLARLEKEGLAPIGPADKLTLIRRATLDLTGLPPTTAEIDAFLADSSVDAFAKVVDRLLDSPRYGESWGRMWLDVARFGEDDYRSLDPKGRGFNPYPNAYLYRDWVIKAFNDDMPYDQFVRSQLAGDLLGESGRARTLPALGFLGLGPWYYDNGAVEITRADERHDRVDVVSRGFLGLTVGCARCHDHKYDPIPTSDYYSLAGVFLDTSYREYPLAPKSVVDEYNAHDKLIEKKEALLDDFMQTESMQLGQALALQASRYMAAAWHVTGELKEDMPKVVDREKLDYELFDRWLKFLAKPPRFYPYLTKWQAMIKSGGSAGEAKTLADEFQALLLEVMFERKELNDENDIIKAKALPGTKKKERAKLPSDFVTNDDFCPNCGLELKSMAIERQNLFTDVFQRDLQEGFDPAQAYDLVRPGLLAFRGWGLERRLSAERQGYVKALRDDIENLRKEQPPKYPFVHGVGDVEQSTNLRISLRGSPYNLGPEVPRHFLSILSEGAPAPFSAGSGRLELANAILQQPITRRVIVNRIWKGHFGTGLVDTPSNFGVPLAAFRGRRDVHEEAAPRHHAERGLSAEHRAQSGGIRQGLRESVVLARESAPHDGRTDSRFATPGVRRARYEDGRSVVRVDAAGRSPDGVRQNQPLQARRLSAALRFSEPESVGREAVHDERAAAASVLHEQRLHAAAGRAPRANHRRGAGQCSPHHAGVPRDLRSDAERGRDEGRTGVHRDRTAQGL
jgi:hypothetical protein